MDSMCLQPLINRLLINQPTNPRTLTYFSSIVSPAPFWLHPATPINGVAKVLRRVGVHTRTRDAARRPLYGGRRRGLSKVPQKGLLAHPLELSLVVVQHAELVRRNVRPRRCDGADGLPSKGVVLGVLFVLGVPRAERLVLDARQRAQSLPCLRQLRDACSRKKHPFATAFPEVQSPWRAAWSCQPTFC